MKDPRLLTVQDLSCVGQCSLTAALPVLAACGVETAALPAAVLSTHTGGFTGVALRDLTEEIPNIEAHWKKEGVAFDAFLTGYLSSSRQIDLVEHLIDTVAAEDRTVIVDPAMADHGKLYTGFSPDFVTDMERLCRRADYLLPNLTEACLLTGTPYREDWDETSLNDLMDALEKKFSAVIVLTGVSPASGQIGAMVSRRGKRSCPAHEKLGKSFYGTGDLFAAAFTGALLRGRSPKDAADLAGAFVGEAIRATIDDPDHWYGTKFQKAIPFLIRAIEAAL